MLSLHGMHTCTDTCHRALWDTSPPCSLHNETLVHLISSKPRLVCLQGGYTWCGTAAAAKPEPGLICILPLHLQLQSHLSCQNALVLPGLMRSCALQMSAFQKDMDQLKMTEKILVRDGKRSIRIDLNNRQQLVPDLLDTDPPQVTEP